MDSTVKNQIRLLEELTMSAWPALQTVFFDGWVLSFSDGYTLRANCINLLYPSNEDIHEKIGFCEQIYKKRNLPVAFKFTPATTLENLEEILARAGYQSGYHTSIQVMELDKNNYIKSDRIIKSEMFSKEWLENFCQLSSINAQEQSTIKRILMKVATQCCYISIREGEKTVACGAGVLQGEYLGLYHLVTDINFRKRGLGKEMALYLLNWGKDNGANKAYLQVLATNLPAINLYYKIGFRELYQYWYRYKDI